MGNAVVQFLPDWEGVGEHVAGLCFDASSSTGTHTGAITENQEAFQKNIPFLACRQHTLEITADAVLCVELSNYPALKSIQGKLAIIRSNKEQFSRQ